MQPVSVDEYEAAQAAAEGMAFWRELGGGRGRIRVGFGNLVFRELARWFRGLGFGRGIEGGFIILPTGV